MQIDLKPFDTLFFRDGKPFNMSEEVWANGLFPPPPSVVYGALRTAYFSHHLTDLEQAGGTNDPTSDLQIRGLYLTKGAEVFLPCPADIVLSKNEQFSVLALTDFSGHSSSYPCSAVLKAKDADLPVKPLEKNCYVSQTIFEEYLAGNVPSEILLSEEFFEKEPKLGIKKSPETGSSAEGMLYRVEMFRPKAAVSLRVDVTDSATSLALPSHGILNMGGEGKSLSYQTQTDSMAIKAPALIGQRFKLVFASPSIFEQGWLPSGFDQTTLIGNWRGCPVKILAATFDRPAYLGGFAMKTKHQRGGPKPMRRAVPAGAVYYLEALENIQDIIPAFHGQCISELGTAKEGFGLCFVGAVPK